MEDYKEQITRLAALGGDNPTIRTADGRTLRGKCWACLGRGWFSDPLGHMDDWRCDSCQGRSWVPVDRDEALAVCIERIGAIVDELVIVAPDEVTNSWSVENAYDLNCADTLGSGDTVYAAVFAAAKQVVKK